MTPEPRAVQGQPRLRIGPYGWEHAAWQGSFYPDDLPADWRLSFLGTVAQAVLVPESGWQAAGAADGARWATEVPDTFRFYLEVADPAGLAVARPCAAALGDRLGGLLVRQATDAERNAPATLGADSAVPLFLPAAAGHGAGWRRWAEVDDLPVVGGVAVLLLRMAGLDLRALRRALEAFAQSQDRDADLAVLVLDPGPSATRLRELRVLAELLGLA